MLPKFSRLLAITFILLAVEGNLISQSKYEVEHHIRSADVPLKALKLVETLPLRGKVKWFYEENLKGNSFEAKNKSDHHRYSIEFDTMGNFLDIEIDIRWKQVDTMVQTKIQEDLSERFEFSKLRKIQIQYSDPSHLPIVVGKGSIKFNLPHRYEIVLEGKKNNLYQLFEVTYDQHGKWIKSYDILPGNSDILEY